MENLILRDKNVPSTTFNSIGYTNTLNDKTKKVYMSTIKEFFKVEDLNDITIDMMQEVTPDTANEWAVAMLEQGLKKSTVNKKMSALKNFYKYLCRRTVGVMTYNPFDTDEGAIRYKNTIPDYSPNKTLSAEEVSMMIAVASAKKGLEGLRNKIILEVLWTTGMRREEVAYLKIGNIKSAALDGVTTHTFSFEGKGSKMREPVIDPTIYEEIIEYIGRRNLSLKNREEPLFVSHSYNADKTKSINDNTVYRIVKDAAKKAGLNPDDIHPHTFRHSFATTLHASGGIDVKNLKDLMGHSSINTTDRYVHSAETLKNSSEAASKLAGLIKNETV